MMKITEAFLEQGKSQRGSWSKKQLELLGVSYPLQSGWKEQILGQTISDRNAQLFLDLKDQHLKKDPTPQPKFSSSPAQPIAEVEDSSTVIIYTDGACMGNPGVGGWAALLKYGSHTKEIFGSEPTETTNNRMEIKAAIEGLKALKRPCKVRLCSDSQLMINTMKFHWKKNANKDLWAELEALSKIHQVEWVWVKGHADNPFNNRVDELAFQAAKSVNI